MKVIGFSSGVTGRVSNVDRMVTAILSQSGGDVEFVKLTDLSYSGCKGCVQLCAKPQVCLLKDDLLPYYQKIKDTDGISVIGEVKLPLGLDYDEMGKAHFSQYIEPQQVE